MNQSPLFSRRAFLAMASSLPLVFVSNAKTAQAAQDTRVFEMRIYTTNEGKMPDLLKRFRDHSCALLEKHGIQNIGYWTPIEKADGADDTLIYVVAHKSREDAKASWTAFGQDPQWKEVAKASEANGKLLAKKPEAIFMTATDYSAAIAPSVSGSPRVFELRTYTTPEGKLDALNARFRDHTVGLFTKHGMTHIGYWLPTDADKGAGTKLMYILSHKSQEAGAASFSSFRADPAWVAAKAASEKNGSLTVQPDGVKSVYLRATDFSPIR
jgi:hypothetical protein